MGANDQKLRLLSRIKQYAVPGGRKARTIKAGAFRGIKMMLDLGFQTQLYLGLHERELYRWSRRLSNSIETAIDSGADEGDYPCLFVVSTPA